MSCDKCGMSCTGRLCRDCERMDHQENYYGTTEDNFDWSDEEGQTTLTDGDSDE
jgi:hypothetical protein